MAHLLEHRPEVARDCVLPGTDREGPPVVELRRPPVLVRELAPYRQGSRGDAAVDAGDEREAAIQTVGRRDSDEVAFHDVEVRIGHRRTDALPPADEVGHVAAVLRQEVALEDREPELQQVEVLRGVQGVERVELVDEGAEVEAAAHQVATQPDLVLVDDQHLLRLRAHPVEPLPEPRVLEDRLAEDQEVGADVQVVELAHETLADHAGLRLVDRQRTAAVGVALEVVAGHLQAPPVTGPTVHLREDLVEGADQEPAVVGQDDLVVAVDRFPTDQVTCEHRVGPEVVGPVRDRPRASRHPV